MAEAKPLIIACIPAYNEEKTIAKVVLQTKKYVDKVFVCDDGSMDMTGEIAERLGAEVLRHERNLGKGAALKTLFKESKSLNPDVVVTLDSDGQHDPREIPMLIRPILRGEANITNGSRLLEKTEMPKYRVVGNKMLSSLINVKTGQKLTDTQSGFRAYSKKALKFIEITDAGIGVDSQVLIDASEKDLKVVEIPVTVSYECAKSTYNPLSHLSMVIASVIRKIVEGNPIFYLGIPGFISVIAGLLFGLRVVDIFLSNSAIAIGTALISVSLVIIGFLLIIAAVLVKTVNSVAIKMRMKA